MDNTYAIDKTFLSPSSNANKGCSAGYIRQTWHMDFFTVPDISGVLRGKAVNVKGRLICGRKTGPECFWCEMVAYIMICLCELLSQMLVVQYCSISFHQLYSIAKTKLLYLGDNQLAAVSEAPNLPATSVDTTQAWNQYHFNQPHGVSDSTDGSQVGYTPSYGTSYVVRIL